MYTLITMFRSGMLTRVRSGVAALLLLAPYFFFFLFFFAGTLQADCSAEEPTTTNFLLLPETAARLWEGSADYLRKCPCPRLVDGALHSSSASFSPRLPAHL